MTRRLVHILHPNDNVATALVELQPRTVVEPDRGDQREPAASRVEIRSTIPFGHKLALQPIARGQPVVKYGEVIGLATANIAPGEHVHVHNVESQRGRGDLAAARAAGPRTQG